MNASSNPRSAAPQPQQAQSRQFSLTGRASSRCRVAAPGATTAVADPLITDEQDPYGIVTSLMSAVPAGSHLALSQVASDVQVARPRLGRHPDTMATS